MMRVCQYLLDDRGVDGGTLGPLLGASVRPLGKGVRRHKRTVVAAPGFVPPEVAELGELGVEHHLDEEESPAEPAPAKPRPEEGLGGDSYGRYLAALRELPRLDREEEQRLAVEYQQHHDGAIAEKLVTANLRLVVKLAHEYTRVHRNLPDLIQEGNIGLVEAIDRFDPTRNVKLSTYAAWWIRAYMLRYLLHSARLVRLGTTANQRKLFFNLRKQRDKLERMGIAPSAENVAAAMALPLADVIEMAQRLDGPDSSLDAPLVHDDEDGRSRLDLLESAGGRPDTLTEEHESQARLHEAFASFGATLDGRERELFERRLLAEEPRTLQELGVDFGISRERTRQLELRLMARLREHLTRRFGDLLPSGPSAGVEQAAE